MAHPQPRVPEIVWWTIANIPIVPSPEGLAAPSPTDVPLLSWQSVPVASSYNVYADGVLIGTTNQTDYTDATAAPGEHLYTVAAVDDFGSQSAQSHSLEVLVQSAPAPQCDALRWHDRNTLTAIAAEDQPGTPAGRSGRRPAESSLVRLPCPRR